MTNPGPTKEEYDILLYKLATLESELGHARKLLEAPAKRSLWRRFWGLGPKAAAVALAVALLLLPGVSCAQEGEREALLGLRGVYVLVKGMRPGDTKPGDTSPQAERQEGRLGLTEESTKASIEWRLRSVGIRVLTRKELDEIPGAPCLVVTVETIFRSGGCAYSVRAEVVEEVTLARGPKTRVVIWYISSFGYREEAGITSFIQSQVNDVADIFAMSYNLTNPRK
jgi:hypothetical protein